MQDLLTLAKEFGLSVTLLIFGIIYLVRKNDSIDKKIVELLNEQREFLQEMRLIMESSKKIETQEFNFQMDKILSRIDVLKEAIDRRLSQYDGSQS